MGPRQDYTSSIPTHPPCFLVTETMTLQIPAGARGSFGPATCKGYSCLDKGRDHAQVMTEPGAHVPALSVAGPYFGRRTDFARASSFVSWGKTALLISEELQVSRTDWWLFQSLQLTPGSPALGDRVANPLFVSPPLPFHSIIMSLFHAWKH